MADVVLKRISVEIGNVEARPVVRRRPGFLRRFGSALLSKAVRMSDWDVSNMRQASVIDNSVAAGAAASAQLMAGQR